MDTKSNAAIWTAASLPTPAGTFARGAAAAVTGARHVRADRNGQDAAALWIGDAAAAIVVCDGCGSGASSEIGARLGATLWLRALERQLAAGAAVADRATWERVRGEVVAELGRLACALGGDAAIADCLLFTVVAAAVDRDAVAVWALGDGAYGFGGDAPHALGPFADNAPPYLAYDLSAAASSPAAPAHFATAARECGGVLVATDGAAELELAAFADARFVDHPDALRRRLAVLARTDERIDWDARQLVRTRAPLQDDGAIAILRWAVPA